MSSCRIRRDWRIEQRQISIADLEADWPEMSKLLALGLFGLFKRLSGFDELPSRFEVVGADRLMSRIFVQSDSAIKREYFFVIDALFDDLVSVPQFQHKIFEYPSEVSIHRFRFTLTLPCSVSEILNPKTVDTFRYVPDSELPDASFLPPFGRHWGFILPRINRQQDSHSPGPPTRRISQILVPEGRSNPELIQYIFSVLKVQDTLVINQHDGSGGSCVNK